MLEGETVSPGCRSSSQRMETPDMPCIHKRGQQQWVSENYYRSRTDCGFSRSVPFDAISGTKSS